MGQHTCDKCAGDKRLCECARYVAQEGGDHYQNEYQHWDWVTDIGMGYLPASATKYVSRWRKKNGLQDLKKAMTYIDKMIAVLKMTPDYKFNREPSYRTRVLTDRFVAANQLTDAERDFCEVLTGPCPMGFLLLAKNRLWAITTTAQKAQEALAYAAPTQHPPEPSNAVVDKNSGRAGAAGGTGAKGQAASTSTEHPAPFGYTEENEI